MSINYKTLLDKIKYVHVCVRVCVCVYVYKES